ncbi:NAD(P)-binding protein [Motiliproteus sp. SC1-56]|uniref:NAD(P)-binding protein n=1 Tax=Motiliproteus sp. SC1-56 TaxID=2799565 RepID=UPI001A8F5910|nr:NAD(P)-binding protein [Motiliproteus sp. SC1-56]
MNKPFAITLDVGTSLVNHTGSWRTERPRYVDRIPPCNKTCPAGENIQQWLFHAEEGNYEQAFKTIMQDNPFPTIMGRVCYHTCESACNRKDVDEAVGINAVERFIGDEALRHGWTVECAPDTGKKVMVIGAGPGGLSAAYHLRRLGHSVTVFEAAPKAGGMLRYGIPKYRLPREKLAGEISRIEKLGVEIKTASPVTSVADTMKEGGFDACFLSVGAQVGGKVELPTDGSVPMFDAATVLKDLENEQLPDLNGHVVVYGGGNTAMDVARSATRMGALSVTVVYRRDRNMMPAHELEIHEALEEGVQLACLRTIKAVKNGELELEVMVTGEDNRPVGTGQTETVPATVLVQAVGQSVDLGPLNGLDGVEVKGGVVLVGKDMQTGAKGVFAGGDMIPSERTVTVAIGHGKKAAKNIDAFLRGEIFVAPAKHDDAGFGELNTWYYSDAPRSVRPVLDVARRQSGFAEVVGNLDEETAQYEARRCMSCGNCFECDNCYGVCPDNAITKLGPGEGFAFKYDYCKGCGICVAECPCGSIEMVPEDI